MRKIFADFLYKKIEENKNILLITADLGYGLFDKIRKDFPDNFINCGASEQLMTGLGIGACYEGKTPVLYSITPFLLYRPFELIRNYINKENLNIKLVGSGRNKDYSHDGFSHWAEDDVEIMNCFDNITMLRPNDENILDFLELMFDENTPFYINLKR